MRILSDLFGKPSPTPPDRMVCGPVHLDGPGEFAVAISGESHYQDALEAICGRRKREGEEKVIEAMLVYENKNRYDSLAIRVEIEGKTVGYLSRENAPVYRKAMEEAGHPGVTATCQAQIRGGWGRGKKNKGHYGVWLDLPN